jgi:hypothetical protein
MGRTMRRNKASGKAQAALASEAALPPASQFVPQYGYRPPQPVKKRRARPRASWFKRLLATALLLASIAAIVVVVVKMVGRSDDTPTGGPGGAPAGNPVADVSGLAVTAPNAFGMRTVTATVTNHSGQRASYVIVFALTSRDGATKYDEIRTAVDGLAPGKSTRTETLPFTSAAPSSAVARVQAVTRSP